MLDDAELTSLLLDMESDRVERKASLSDRDRVCEAICAFANDLPDHRQPGALFVGVNDDGTCSGLRVTDELLLTLADLRSSGNILPLPEMSVEKRTLAGCECAAIVVQPSLSPPVRYRGRVWIRVGPRRAIASREEERRLSERRRSFDLPFDHQPVRGSTLDDLDLSLFERVYLPSALPPDLLRANERTMVERLQSLHFLGQDGTPNVAGILTLGLDPRAWIPCAYLQFVRFAGDDPTAAIQHQQELDGALPNLLQELDRLLAAQISVATSVPGTGPESRRPDYPLNALSQMVRNAVLHRSYEATNAPARVYWFSDRVEIHSPGGPFGQVTKENFGQPGMTDYRNPLIGEAMKSLGYVQRFGIGFPLARKELSANGNPELTTEANSSAVLVTLRRRP